VLIENFRLGLLAACSLLATGVASSALAKSVIITTVATGNGDEGNVSVVGYGTPWTTPILMTDTSGQTFVVFCDDLNHDVFVGGGQSLPYDIGPVKVNGNGAAITETVSNEMGQLADLGDLDFGKGNEDGAIAAQAAIWGIEYDTGVSSTDPTIENDILQDLEVTNNGQGYAIGLISTVGVQSQIIGIPAAPEPASWALLLIGVGGLGAALRRAKHKGRLAAASF
jgi:PEP-CTERM motif